MAILDLVFFFEKIYLEFVLFFFLGHFLLKSSLWFQTQGGLFYRDYACTFVEIIEVKWMNKVILSNLK